MTDALQRLDRPDNGSDDRQTSHNLVDECYKDFSALSTRLADNTANLPNIEIHSGDQQENCSVADSSGPATRGSDSPASKLISKLGDEDFSEREKATEELKKLGPSAMPDLLKATKDEDPEVAARAKRIVEDVVGKSIQTQLRGLQFELMHGDLPGKDAQEQSKKLKEEYDKYNNDPQEKERRIKGLEQMQKEVGKELTPEQNRKIEEQLHDLKNMGEVKWRLHNISEFADIRADEEEEARLGKFLEQFRQIGPFSPIGPIRPGDIEPPDVALPDIDEWDLRQDVKHPVQLEGIHGGIEK